MSYYILDTSIVVQRLIRDAQTPNVLTLFRESNQHTLLVPEFCLLECTNVLWKNVRFQGLPQAQAEKLVEDLIALPLISHSVSDLMPDALSIGLKYNLAVYDSLYLAMAKKLNLPFITVDVRQEAAAKAEGISLKAITAFKP